MRTNCRIWWPDHLSLYEPSSSNFLFGWFIPCSSASIDIIVGFACDEVSLSLCQPLLPEVLRYTNEKMAASLRDKSLFSLLGQGKMFDVGKEHDLRKSCTNCLSAVNYMQNMSEENYGRCCKCDKLDELVNQNCEASAKYDLWIQFVYSSHKKYGKGRHWLPRLDHIHWNGSTVSQFNVHVIVYQTPVYGSHHFSLYSFRPEAIKASSKKPKWIDELECKEPLLGLDTVIMAINSTAAAKLVMEKHMDSKQSSSTLLMINMCLDLMWHIFAVSVASVSTLFYATLQILFTISRFGSRTKNFVVEKIFRNTFTNIRIRCCQILYWPIFLQDNELRSQSCVEYAERTALFRHSMWLSLIVDLLLGNLLGLLILYYAESICSWISVFANDVTNELLRSGCVWLMGVPAGFKLNPELAAVLGMISLNAIQIWSTLWIFVGFLFIYFIRGLAVLGVILGATVSSALVIDTVALATFHISALHCAIALIYSQQIQALAALWRLFRGRKWNPLRKRLDSYNYTVKQHIVGSLLFTPLLLLLPTTSVFYVFFTILDSAIAFVCIFVEVTISVIHGTPYVKIFLWLLRRGRFPSGIWLEIMSCRSDPLKFIDKTSENIQQKDTDDKGSSILVSFLRSNFLTLGEIVLPHYKKVFSGVSSFLTASAYGALTGKRNATNLDTGLPSAMPWMCIPSREYWRICYQSILSCGVRRNCKWHNSR